MKTWQRLCKNEKCLELKATSLRESNLESPNVSSQNPRINEMKLILKFKKLKRLMALKVYHDGFKSTNSLDW